MNEAAKAAKREYFRQWRANNPDKVKEYHRRYWEKKAAAAEEANSTGQQVGGDVSNG